MLRAQKTKVVEALRKTFEEASVVVVTHQSGLTVEETNDLRRQIRDGEAGYRVTKNTLAKLAIAETDYESLEPLFSGPTAIAFSADPVSAAKVVVEYANKNDKLTVIGGALGTSVLDADGVKALAKMPSIEELRAKLLGLMQAAPSKLVGVLQAPPTQMARVLAAPGGELVGVLRAQAAKNG